MKNSIRIGNLRNGKVDKKTVGLRLLEARRDPTINEVYLVGIDFTQFLVDAVSRLFSRTNREWKAIKLISCTGMIEKVVEVIFRYDIETLVLSGTHTDCKSLFAVDQGLKTNHSIKRLRLLAVPFVDSKFTFEGLTRNTSLVELDLSRSHLKKDAVMTLASALERNRNIEVIKLEDCSLDDESMAEIMTCVKDHPCLKKMNLCENSSNTLTMTALAGLIRSEKSVLESLNLSSQQLTKEDEFDQCSFADAVIALQTNASLKELDISCNHYTDEAVKLLASTLSLNSSLETLKINDSNITANGLRVLAKNLHSFRVKTLDIAGNDLDESVARELVEGLQNNRILESMGPIDAFNPMIEHYLDLNLAGRRAMQDDIPLAVWPHLLARTNTRIEMAQEGSDDDDAGTRTTGRKLNMLYSLLCGPALFQR